MDRYVWVYDLLRGTLTRLTTDGQSSLAAWTPDGKRLAFQSTTTGAFNLFWKPADGSGAAERLTTSEYQQSPGSWSPDGKTLAFTQIEPTTQLDIWTLSLAARDRTARPFLQTAAWEAFPEFSPDGRWLAYAPPPAQMILVQNWVEELNVASRRRSDEGRMDNGGGTGPSRKPRIVTTAAGGPLGHSMPYDRPT